MVCVILSGIMCIKEPLVLIGKSSYCGSSRFHISLSEWSFTICLTPYNHKYNVLSASLNKPFPSFLPSFCCRFLFDNQSAAHTYYRWKLFSILQVTSNHVSTSHRYTGKTVLPERHGKLMPWSGLTQEEQ